MWSRVLTFEESGIDHVGLIQICFSAEATVLHVCEKNSLPVSVVFIEHCVWSSQRSGFDSQSSLKFFSAFFFNCLGCLFNCEDHIFFPLSYLYPQFKIWVILLMKLLINVENKYHSLFKTWVAERKFWQHFPYQPTVWFLWGALYTQHLSYTCIVIRRTKILWILEVLLVVSKTK